MQRPFFLKRMVPAIVALLVIAAGIPWNDVPAGEPAVRERLVILFTHDLHSYFLPQRIATPDGPPVERGGYAKLLSLIRENRDGEQDAPCRCRRLQHGNPLPHHLHDGSGGTPPHGGDGLRCDDPGKSRF